MNKIKKIVNAWICTIEDNNVVPVFGDIEIEAGVIKKIVQKQNIDSTKSNYKYTLDAEGRVITIPLINFHDHFYSRLSKGVPIKGSMANFSLVLENLWWKLDMMLDLEMVKASTQMAAIESIKNGVTYIFDHHASPAHTTGSLSEIKNVLSDFELNGVLCFETSDRNGKKYCLDALEENITFHKKESNEKFKGMLGLHASFTLDDDTLSECKNIIEENNIGIHIHLCEDKADRNISLRKYGKTPLQRLSENNLLNGRSILAHGVHLTEEEYDIISASKTAIVFNLDSNLNNAVGLPSLSSFPESVTLLPGTDGMHANIARSLKQMFLIYRHQGNSMNDAFSWFIKNYFNQINYVNKYFPKFSLLKTNDNADFIMWDYIPPTPFHQNNFWGHFIYGILERPVHSVFQNGKVLMKNYQLQFENIQSVNDNITRLGNILYKMMDKAD